MRTRTGQTFTQISRAIRTFFSLFLPEQARDYGLIDKVISVHFELMEKMGFIKSLNAPMR